MICSRTSWGRSLAEEVGEGMLLQEGDSSMLGTRSDQGVIAGGAIEERKVDMQDMAFHSCRSHSSAAGYRAGYRRRDEVGLIADSFHGFSSLFTTVLLLLLALLAY